MKVEPFYAQPSPPLEKVLISLTPDEARQLCDILYNASSLNDLYTKLRGILS